ncbi:MAG: hypothetical protein ACLVKJ_00725 [Acutalibacteraceae bacterium]
MVNLKEGKQLQDLLQSLQEPIETVELRLPITKRIFVVVVIVLFNS